jgi:hypothetical protein
MLILRALIVGAVLTGCLASPVYAQKKTPMQLIDEQKKKDAEEADKQYKSTMERTRKDAVETRASDPWQNMRGADDSKTKR